MKPECLLTKGNLRTLWSGHTGDTGECPWEVGVGAQQFRYVHKYVVSDHREVKERRSGEEHGTQAAGEQGSECVTTEPRPPVCPGSHNSTGLSHPLNRTHTSGSFRYHESSRDSAGRLKLQLPRNWIYFFNVRENCHIFLIKIHRFEWQESREWSWELKLES